ncbi:M13 family metallopeptidase, partial [Flavobacteriaceae bacterium]|nr:M13 family metallopeptidase [Flavobacteriaceae bacterium]
MNLKHLTVLYAISFLGFNGCKTDKNALAGSEKIPGIVLENMDPNVSPKDNFYDYVNGNWMKTNTIPDEESRWGGFGVLRKSTRKDVLDIIKTSKELGTYEEGSDQKKALLMFESELDSVARTNAGITPILPLLEAINSIQSIADMQTVYAKTVGVSAPFAGITAQADLNDSSMNTAWVYPGGLGLQRDYYLDQDTKSKEIRGQYVDHVARMFKFLKYDDETAQAAAKRVLELETQLAKPRLDKVQRRDIRNLNNPRSVSELNAITPTIDWNKFIKDMGVTAALDTVLVMQPKYMKALDIFLSTTPIEDIKTLMTWSTIDSAAGFLTPEIETANWEFYSKTLNGS